MKDKIFKKIYLYVFSAFIFCNVFWGHQIKNNSPYDINYLEKIEEFEIILSIINEFKVRLLEIDSFCCAKNAIYIADSGLNQIIKLDLNGKYIESYGGEGQGPGEFKGRPTTARLSITFGNDGKFYVYDMGNNRLNIFSEDFTFIKSFNMPLERRIIDTPVINSDGHIYFVAIKESNLLHKFDNEMKLIHSFFNKDFHTNDKLFFSGEFDLRKKIFTDDKMVIVSNYCYKAFIINKNDEIENEFEINNKIFTKDFAKRVKELKKNKARGDGTILPFYLFLDKTNKIYLCYKNSEINNFEIYRYNLDGELIDILRFPDDVITPMDCDNEGNIYAKKYVNGKHILGKYFLNGDKNKK